MKILKIEFRNINALRGTHTIDFTVAPFTTHSLFAITGPTGSGKSTILDVISLALFNNIPRLDKVSRSEIESKGAILTRNQKEAFAKVTYACGRGTYQSVWEISTNRNNNLRSHGMELWDLSSNQMLDLKKSEVPAKNEELIGLSYNQFIKSVLLAQGEFAQFIQAKKSERGDLLEKITGTGIYRQLGQLAYERFKTENMAIKQQADTISIKTATLLPDEEYEKINFSLKAKEQQVQPLEQKIEVLNRNIALKDSILKQESVINSLELKKTETATKLKQFEAEKGSKLQQHERLAPMTEEIAQWHTAKETKQETEAERQKIAQENKIAEDGLRNLKKDIHGFIKEAAEDADLPEALSNFAQKVDGLQKDLNEKRTKHKNISALFGAEMKSVDFALRNKPGEDYVRLQTLAEDLAEKTASIKNALGKLKTEAPEEEKKRLNQEIKQLNEAFRHQEKINQSNAKIKGLERDLEENQTERQNIPEQIKKTQERIDQLSLLLKNKQQEEEIQKLKASLKEHRARLIAGEPCPLCGALEHSFAEHLPQSDDHLKKQITNLDKELREVNKENIQLRTKLEGLEKTGQKLQLSIRYERAVLEQIVARSPFALSGKIGLEEDVFIQQVKKYEDQLEGLDQFIKLQQQQEAILKGLPLLRKLRELLDDGLDLKQKLDQLYDGKDIYKETQKLQNQWSALTEKERALTKNARELDKKHSLSVNQLDMLEKTLNPKIVALGFETLAQAKSNILSNQNYSQLKKEKDELVNQSNTIHASVQTLQTQLDELKKEDILENRENLSESIAHFREQLSLLRSENEKLRRRIENHKDTLKEIELLKNEIASREKQIRRWRLLNELIGDATGKKFNEFAQDLTLSQLLNHANHRLSDLSDRYLMDKPIEGEDDGLVAIDNHMGGQRRSVKTLSGGETFILSLSMALALSDLASRHVEINSLFIDEGFGTLDPETLDQTLDTLERLEAESSKTIGIISHVESLKERIAAQIQLKRQGQGYSTLSIK